MERSIQHSLEHVRGSKSFEDGYRNDGTRIVFVFRCLQDFERREKLMDEQDNGSSALAATVVDGLLVLLFVLESFYLSGRRCKRYGVSRGHSTWNNNNENMQYCTKPRGMTKILKQTMFFCEKLPCESRLCLRSTTLCIVLNKQYV